MAAFDDWLKIWLKGGVPSKSGAYRCPGPLHVYAMSANGPGVEFSGPLPAWTDLAERLRDQRIQIGMVAVELSPEHAYFKYPGVTLAFDGPQGGTQVAREVMQKLGQLGVGGILAGTENDGRFGVLRIIMAPRWCAETGDNLFGVDWSTVPNDPVHCEEAKKAWAQGIHGVLAKVLAELPEVCVDTIRLGAFDVVDWLHDLGPRERAFLYVAKPRQLGQALEKLGSYDLEALSSVKPRPFDEGGPLLTLYDVLGEEVSFAWLCQNVSTPMCHVLHVRGRSEDHRAEILICLLRRMNDGRVRLTTVTMSPDSPPLLEDCFEVSTETLLWTEGFISPIFGVGKVLEAFAERCGDLHEPGTWHQPSFAVEMDEIRPALIKWFCKSSLAGITHDLIADLRSRVYPHLRSASAVGLDERELSVDEAEQLTQWLFEEGQQELELRWLLDQWRREWRNPGPEPHELEQFLRGI